MESDFNTKVCDRCKKNEYKIETTDELLSLMNIYYSEWAYRDASMWKQMCIFFFAAFIVILLPFAKIWSINLADIIPDFIFPIIGILLAFVFLYISLEYANRLSKIGETYRDLIEYLPKEFQRKQIHNKNEITKGKQLAYVVPILMFSTLIVLGIVLFILCLIN